MLAVQDRVSRALTLAEALKLFGFEELKPEQEPLITASIAGKHVVGILPTGMGKSACYIIPGLVTGEKTIVISPLIALQEDQVQMLRKRGVHAYAMHSNMDEVRKAVARMFFKRSPKGEPAFLYISPEMFLSETFWSQMSGVHFDRIAVDEAHCVSTWGNSFRPDYLRIRAGAERMKITHCSAFTATTDEKIERDIVARLPLNADYVKIEASPMRPNLLLNIEDRSAGMKLKTVGGRSKLNRLGELLLIPEFAGPTIVYCSSRTGSATLYESLRKGAFCRQHGYTPYLFHAEVGYVDKTEALRGFQNDEKPLVVATSAFGLGIDRADVRQIVHYNIPHTLIDYAQQIGRAGRDNKPSLCTAFHAGSDYLDSSVLRINRDMPSVDFLIRTLENIHKSFQRSVAKKKRFRLKSYTVRVRELIENSETVDMKDAYMTRFMTTISLLEKVGLIEHRENGEVVRLAPYGSIKFDRLLEETKMHERMLIREKQRLADFFGAEEPKQELLWEIIRRK
jgi:RecQ family ATP-dependent DNA helicase